MSSCPNAAICNCDVWREMILNLCIDDRLNLELIVEVQFLMYLTIFRYSFLPFSAYHIYYVPI